METKNCERCNKKVRKYIEAQKGFKIVVYCSECWPKEKESGTRQIYSVTTGQLTPVNNTVHEQKR